VIWWLKDSKKERDSNIMKAVVGLIKYDGITQEKIQNISENKKEFAERFSAKGVPDAICDLLLEKYVVEATVEEAIENHRFLSDIKVMLKATNSEAEVSRALFGLIKYDAITQEKLQNVGRGNYDKFKEELSAEGVPKAICDLLFEKYVVEATVLEAIGKHAFLKEVKGLIDEEMPSLKKQEVFFGLFGLMKYPATTKVQLQNISDNKKEFAERLSAKEVPDAICDLLFEKYVAKNGLNRNGSQTKSFRDIEEICSSVFKNIVPSKLKFEFERYSIESTEFPTREHDKLSIPKVPQMNKPYMLFYQLKDENHTHANGESFRGSTK